MKKGFALLLVLVLMVSLTACSGQNLTMKKLVEVNSIDKLLETYDSIYVHTTSEDKLYNAYYLTKEYSFEMHETWGRFLTGSTGYAYENGVYQRVVYLTREGLIDGAAYRNEQLNDAIISPESSNEKIQASAETDNQLSVKSTFSEKQLEDYVGSDQPKSLETTYTMDAKTYHISSIKATLTLDDGTNVNFRLECTYNGEMPEEMKQLLAYHNQTEDLRTITFVFHPGTDQEKSETVTSPKGLVMGLFLPEGAGDADNFTVYADRECTIAYQSNGDYTSDLTVYIK